MHMKNGFQLAPLVLGLIFNLSSYAQAQIDCDTLFSRRGSELLSAAECYQSKLNAASTVEDQFKLYEMSFISLSVVVNQVPRSADERAAINQGVSLSQQLAAAHPGSAHALYWTAVFISFDAIAKDRGSPIPTHTIGSIRAIQTNLRQAIQLNPKIHFYGPSRVLGIMNSKMPSIVGGDKILAEKLLREAYQQVPALADNHLSFARILITNGKREEAKAVLTEFLSLESDRLEPYPGNSLLSFAPEIAQDKKTATDLLAVLNDSRR